MAEIIKNYTTTYRETTAWERFRSKYLTTKFLVKVLFNLFVYVLLMGIAFIVVYPLFRRLGNAFKSPEDFFDATVVYFPKNVTLDVIKGALSQLKLDSIGLVSFGLAALIGVLQSLVALLVGYGLARFRFRGNNILFFCVLMTLVVPPQTILIPLFLQFRFFDLFGILKLVLGHSVNLLDTYWCQILLAATGLGWKNGLYIYMMRQFFRGVPKELEEAAYIDGAQVFKAFIKVMVPSAFPMMVTIFLFSFSWQWTDTFYTDTFLTQKQLLANVISTITYPENEVMQANMQQTALLIILLPLVLLFIFTQRYFVEGIERSGLTG